MCTKKQKRRAPTSMASLFPLTPYTVLRSLLSVALSSVTAKSIIMIPYILHFVNVQLHRRGCTVSADGIVQPTATRVFNFKRPGCSGWRDVFTQTRNFLATLINFFFIFFVVNLPQIFVYAFALFLWHWIILYLSCP